MVIKASSVRKGTKNILKMDVFYHVIFLHFYHVSLCFSCILSTVQFFFSISGIAGAKEIWRMESMTQVSSKELLN